MLPIELEYVLGDDRTSYEALLAGLPEGDSNLKRGLVVPSHLPATAQTLRFKNLVPNTSYMVDIQGEWESAPVPRVYFSPSGSEHLVTVPLPYGPSTLYARSSYHDRRFFVSVTHYGTVLRTFAKEITEYSKQPLSLLDASISDAFAYRLALPVIAGMSSLIPSDLEFLGVLSNKLLIKNFLHRPGTNGAVREILAAFCASNPVMHKMQNIGALDAPMYRSEETFAGYEAHVWVPNREIERWRAFSILIANLPQFYKMQALSEGEVFFYQGGKLRRHTFDFDSPFANSVLEATGRFDCFLHLFKLTAAVESEHYLNFCQASYALDSKIYAPGLSSPDVDPLQVTNWTGFSLTGRLEQQFGESWGVHRWVYESPLLGEINGGNRFFRLKGSPRSSRSLKVWIDGLLQYLNIDYRISLASNTSAGAGLLGGGGFMAPLMAPGGSGPTMITGMPTLGDPTPYTQTITLESPEPRPFLGPVFTSLEVKGNADLQYVLTVGEQSSTAVQVIVSESPFGSTGGTTDPTQEVIVNYVAPALPEGAYTGTTQYGSQDLPVGTTSYYLEFPRATMDTEYQLFVQLAVNPLPSGGPEAVSQVVAIVKTHHLDGAMVELSAPVADENTHLYWWLIETDGVTMERGTLPLEEGSIQARLDFSNGPYLDKVTLIYQIWNTSLDSSVATILVSNKIFGPGGTYLQFSAPIPDGNYCLDWAVFGSQVAGEQRSFLEFIEAPAAGQLIEVQYDEMWNYWGQGALNPPADGVRREFAMPYPVADEKSVYLTINGHLATYGHDRQYTIDMGRNIAIFSTPPSTGQVLWAVMPLKDPATGRLPSAWDQGFAFSRADIRGGFATATVTGNSRLPVGTSLTVREHPFLGVSPATGTLAITGRVDSAGSFITFQEIGVTLRGVLNPVDSFVFTSADVSVSDNRITKNGHGLIDGRQVTLDTASGLSTMPLGLSLGVTYYVVNADANTLQLSPIVGGPPVDILTAGLGTFQVSSPNENLFKVNVDLSTDGQSLAAAINSHSVLSTIYRAESVSPGVVLVQAKSLGGFVRTKVSTDTLASTTLVVESTKGFSDTGSVIIDGTEYRYSSKNDTAFYGLTPEVSCLSGTTVVSGGKNQTILSGGTGLSTTHITGDTSPASYSSATLSNQRVYSISAAKVTDSTLTLGSGATDLYNGLAVKCETIGTHGLPSGLSSAATYYITNLTELPTGEIAFSLASSPSLTTTVSLGTFAAGFFNLAPYEADGQRLFSKNHTFYNLERVIVAPLTAESLPPNLQASSVYFVRNRTDVSFELSASPTGEIISFTPTKTQFNVKSLPVFPTNVGAGFDFAQLARVLGDSPDVNADYYIDLVDDTTLRLRAKKVGSQFNGLMSASSALTVQNIAGGYDGLVDQTFAAGKVLYTDEGTVLTLDGLSTRLYRPYSGNEFQFTYRPTTRQEPYYIGEVFPIDQHPLDSMVANEPCNYPKGVFTQGLFSQLTDHSFTHELDSKLVVSTTTLPFQEQPSGSVDGVNREFTTSLASVAGQNSLMLFINGLFQPSDTYDYQVTVGGGAKITLSVAPKAGQKLWVWYIPVDTLRFEATDVDAATGQITLPNHGLYSGQVVSLWASSGILPTPLEAGTPYYIVNPTATTFQLAETETSPALTFSSSGIGVFRLNPSDSVLYERVDALVGSVDGVNQVFTLPHGPVEDRAAVQLFLEGLYQLQGEDYLVSVGNNSIAYSSVAPAIGQTVWAHYNDRALDYWRQTQIGISDGLQDTFLIPTLLLSDLPTSPDSVLVFLNGLCQRRGVDYSVLVDDLGYPDGNIKFLGGAPEANRKIQVAYIKRG